MISSSFPYNIYIPLKISGRGRETEREGNGQEREQEGKRRNMEKRSPAKGDYPVIHPVTANRRKERRSGKGKGRE